VNPEWAVDERTKKAIVELQRHWLSEYHNAREKVLVELTEKVCHVVCVCLNSIVVFSVTFRIFGRSAKDSARVIATIQR
jgi:hypothetical protein